MNHTPGLSLEDIEYICNKLTFDDVSVRIRKHLREHARLIAAAPTLKAENERLRAEFNDFLQVIQEHTFNWIEIESNPMMVMLTYSQEFKKRLNRAITKAEDALEIEDASVASYDDALDEIDAG